MAFRRTTLLILAGLLMAPPMLAKADSSETGRRGGNSTASQSRRASRPAEVSKPALRTGRQSTSSASQGAGSSRSVRMETRGATVQATRTNRLELSSRQQSSRGSGDIERLQRSGSRDERRDAVDPDRYVRRTAQNDHGPIKTSEWQAHREALKDSRRSGNSLDVRAGSRDGDRDSDRYRDNNRQVPESYHFKDRSPRGPTELGRGYVIQHDTRNHRHHDGCGHFNYDGGWHDFPKEHRHHSGCGHYQYDNDWHRWPRGHRHSSTCGHYYYNGAWFDFPRGHRHNAHCGHDYYDGIWHRFSRNHKHGPNCGHYYYDDDWHYWTRTHRHYAGCGHFYFNSFWYPFPPSYYNYTETVVIYGGETAYYPTTVDRYAGEARDHATRAYERSQRGDYYGAIAAFSTAIATTPDNGPLYLAQGVAYMQAGDLRSSYNKLIEGLRRTPDLSTGHPDLRGLVPDPEQLDWQIEGIRDVIEDNPGNFRAVFVLGYIEFLRGDYENAKVALQAVAALDPDNIEARRLLDFIYQIEASETP